MKTDKGQSVFVEVIKYGMVGAVSTAIDYIFLNLSQWLLHYPTDSLLLSLTVLIGFTAGATNGYFLNSRWTFKFNTEGQEGKKFSQFFIVSFIGLGLTLLIVNYFTKTTGINYNISKAVAVVLVFFWNFLANKFWTFSVKREA